MTSLRTVCLYLLGSALLFAAPEAEAQEIQRPFTEDGTVHTIDRALEKQLQLFPGYDGFREARLYEVDGEYILEIVYQPGDDVLRDREELSAAEVQQLREDVSRRLAQLQTTPALDQSGRTELLVTSTLLSLGFYGYALPLAINLDDGTTFGAMYLLTSGAGFFGPFLLTQDLPVTEGQAKLYRYGSTRGIAHGELIALLIAGDGRDVPFFGTALISSIAEGLLGYHLAGARNMSDGTAETIGVGGDFGLGLGLGTAYLIDPDDADQRLVATPSLIGSIAGLYAGHRLASRTVYTTGDARVLRIAGSLGGLIGLTAVDLTGTGNGRELVSGAMIGSLGGLGLGANFLRGFNFSGSAGTFITLGTLGGLLTGVGTAYLLSDDEDPTLGLTLGSFGAAGGFALVTRSYLDEAENMETGWNIRFNPGGLAARWLPSLSRPSAPVPVLTVNRSF